jgi:tRNA(Ile)-lysidine synthase
VRLDLLPHLLDYNPRLGKAINRYQTLLQEQEDYLQKEASQVFAGWKVEAHQGWLRLPVAKLLALHPALQKRVLRLACAQAGVPLERLAYQHLEAALHLCRQPRTAGEISLPGAWRLVREGNQVVWQTAPPPLLPWAEFEISSPETGRCSFLDWTFTWDICPASGQEDLITRRTDTALMDLHRLGFPLRLRTLRPGDRFQPLGMTGGKKLQDFFVDAKIPRRHRPFLPLLVSRDQIIWVVGHRLSESVKVTPQTRLILKMEACPPQSGPSVATPP